MTPPRLTPGQQALVERNMRLAYHGADLYARRCPMIRRLPRDDRVGAALLGLSEAARRFDPSRGATFSTVAMPWIRHALQREAVCSGVVRLPSDVFDASRKASLERSRCIESAWGVRSLDAQPDGLSQQDADVQDWLGRTRQQGVDPEVEGRIRKAVAVLHEREREAVRLRFWEGQTLDQVGEHLGVCRERARQILAHALERLRRVLAGEMRRMRG